MSISKKKSASKYTVLNVSKYHWVWKVSFYFSLLPLNFHVHTGVRGWAVPCVCKNFHEIRKLRNYTTLFFSENRHSFTTDTHTLKKQIAKIGTNLTSKLCPVRREKKPRDTQCETVWNTPAPYTAGRGNSRTEQKFGSKILSFHHGSKFDY
jgi:hypothetical protein